MFGVGVLVGRLFYKLNPFFMLFGIFIGGAMFATALELNDFYSITILFGIVFGLKIMYSRNAGATDSMGTDSSFFSTISDFFYANQLRREARRFRQAEEEQDTAFDWYFKYRNHSNNEKARAQHKAQEEADRAAENENRYHKEQQQRERDKAQFEKEKQKFEEEIKQKYQQQQESEQPKPDTRSSREILGVSETATFAEIKKAYKKLTLKLHEDRNLNRSPEFIKEAEKELIKARHAYETLTGKKG